MRPVLDRRDVLVGLGACALGATVLPEAAASQAPLVVIAGDAIGCDQDWARELAEACRPALAPSVVPGLSAAEDLLWQRGGNLLIWKLTRSALIEVGLHWSGRQMLFHRQCFVPLQHGHSLIAKAAVEALGEEMGCRDFGV